MRTARSLNDFGYLLGIVPILSKNTGTKPSALHVTKTVTGFKIPPVTGLINAHCAFTSPNRFDLASLLNQSLSNTCSNSNSQINDFPRNLAPNPHPTDPQPPTNQTNPQCGSNVKRLHKSQRQITSKEPEASCKVVQTPEHQAGESRRDLIAPNRGISPHRIAGSNRAEPPTLHSTEA